MAGRRPSRWVLLRVTRWLGAPVALLAICPRWSVGFWIGIVIAAYRGSALVGVLLLRRWVERSQPGEPDR